MTGTTARVSLAVLVAGALLVVVLAVWLVPWHPVPGGTPAPADPRTVFSAAQISEAESFSHWARVWSWSSLAVGLLVACWFGFTGHGARLVERLPGPWWVRAVLAVAVLALIGRLVTLPFAVLLRRLVRDRGLSHQSWTGFAVDLLRSEAVTIVATSIGVVVLLACARRWPGAWPAVAGGLLAVLVVVGSFVYPIVVEPLFNSFTPLPAGQLRSDILRLAKAEHVHVDDVLVADASRRTTTLNAYVSGFGSTRRVVVYDNLVNDLPRREALSVVAHELAHARHQDPLVGAAIGAAGALAGVGLLGLLLSGGAWRREVGDPRVVPLLLALAAVGTLLSSPLVNLVSRQIETRADVDALRVTHDPGAFIDMQRELSVRSLADPTPPAWSQFWFGSHPTALERIAIARQLERSPGAGS